MLSGLLHVTIWANDDDEFVVYSLSCCQSVNISRKK